MAENKTQPTTVSAADFVANIADENRRADCQTLLEMMQTASGQPPVMWGSSIVGFGSYHYRYATGREGDFLVIGFAPRKKDLTLYLSCGFEPHGDLLAKLGKYKTGVSCLYIKSLADVDQTVLRELLHKAYNTPLGTAQ